MTASEVRGAPGSVMASFKLGTLEFAIDVRYVQEVVRCPAQLMQMPLQPDYVRGMFNLRGRIIPLLRTGRLLGRNTEPEHPDAKVAIVHHRGVRLGLAVDDTCRVLRPRPDEVVPMGYAESSANTVVSAVVKLPEGLLSVLDLDRLIALEDVPHSENDTIEDNLIRARLRRKRCITFRVGDLCMAFPIEDIHEIVPASQMQESPLNDPATIGLLRIRDRHVPVIPFAALLRDGAVERGEPPGPEARVILLAVDRHHVGLMVDALDAIEIYTTDQCLPIPVLSRHRASFYSGCIDFGERGHVVLLDAGGVMRDAEIARVTEHHHTLFAKREAGGADARGGTSRSTYLWFSSGQAFAMPMREIREIVEEPDRLIVMPGAPAFVPGMINLRGRMVPVVDLRSFYRLTADCGSQDRVAKILVIDHADGLLGLRVDEVNSIVHVTDANRYAVPALMRVSLPPSLREDMREVIHTQDLDGQAVDLLSLNVSRLATTLNADVQPA